MSSSDDEYSAEETMAGPSSAPSAALQTSAKPSGGPSSGIVIGVLAAGAVVAGGVCYKLLKSGKSKPAPSPAKKVVPPAKKTVAKRTTASAAAAAEPSGTAAAPAPSAAPAAAAAPVAQRSAAPVLPARPAAKKAVPQPAAPVVDESAAAAKAATEKAAAEKAAAEKAAAEKAAADKAAADKAAAEKAAAEKAAADKAAAQTTAAEKAAAEQAAAETAAAEKAAAEKAAAKKAAAEAAAKQKAAADKAAAAAAPAAEQPAAEPAAEPAADGEAAAPAEEGEGEVRHHVLPTAAEVATLVLPAEDVAAAAAAGGEGKPAPLAMAAEEGPVERLGDIAVPPMSFEGAPAEGDLNEVEQKAREMSLHAHKVVKEKNNVVQGSKEQKAALDLLLQPENAGKARPQLVAACAFALGDMLLAQRKVEETKQALAIAYQAATHIEDKGPMVRALMNYAYITKSERKVAATEAAYEEALALARAQHGARHGMVEKIKYEMTAFLGSTGREAEAANMLIQSASELLAEAEKLAAEGEAEGAGAEGKEGGKKEEAKEKGAAGGVAEAANGAAEPPSGFEHAEGEAGGAAAAGEEEEEEESMTPAQTAQHFAMRNLMNAAGVLDGLQQYTRGEELLAKALDIAVVAWGANSMQHLNVLYALAQHFRRRDMLQESIDFHEQVLAIMDESIQVYSPELLQNRIAILRDVAVLMDKVGQGEAAVDYATGALVNAQTLAGIMMGQQRSTTHPILEPFYRLLADLKAKIGDEEGAAEARRMLNEGKLHQRLSQVGKQQQRGGAGGKPGGKRSSSSGASTARAGGRRV
ncbi:hypothetical protein ABPG75_005970 [Micractinium tetrahymenae]